MPAGVPLLTGNSYLTIPESISVTLFYILYASSSRPMTYDQAAIKSSLLSI